jgi:hypothetical protein
MLLDWGPVSFRSKPLDANDDLIKVADLSLINPCPINGLVTARSALSPQAGQIEVGGNSFAGETFVPSGLNSGVISVVST